MRDARGAMLYAAWMTIQRRSIETARGDMKWLEAGAGWPVVLLHAFPLAADMWRPQLEAVPDGWRFIAPDYMSPASITMDDYASDVFALMGRPDSTPALSSISCSTIVIVGEHDEITPPAESEAMHRAIARSTLCVIPGAGHLSSLEQPATFSRGLADFLLARL